LIVHVGFDVRRLGMGVSSEALLWMEILSASGISPRTRYKLVERLGLAEFAALVKSKSGRERVLRFTGKAVSPPDIDFLKRQLEMLERGDFRVACVSDEEYPSLLKEITVPPPIFYYRGDLRVLHRPTICIVGSRAATRRGLLTAERLARELASRGVHVISGLARGIDSAAHVGALEAESGAGTTAVMGTGIDIVYPYENGELAERIAEKGCIITEFAPGTPPHRHNFPQRNRILSGLAAGVVVVEADVRSGAMGTAMWALEQNRDVFAVPGPIDSPMSHGPHRLIKQGAHLVEQADDIIGEISTMRPGRSEAGGLFDVSEVAGLEETERRVLEAVKVEPKHVDELTEICNISPDEILPVLLNLQMRGLVVSTGSNRFARA